MVKAVFRAGEITITDGKVFLEPPVPIAELSGAGEVEGGEEVEEYTGPTVEELRQEAEQFKVQWEAERETMILSAKLEVERIIKEAEDAAAREVTQKTEEAEALKKEAQVEATTIIAEAQQKSQDMISASQATIEKQRKEAQEQGLVTGREMGFKEGKVEVDRLIQRTQVVLERAQAKRNEILVETEQRIIDLVILIARKVIKVISENQREVIFSNVQDALRKVKGRGDIIIRVNTMDLQLTTEHIKDFIEMFESAGTIQIQEDSSVDQGGCIIETDFGEIDARIASQLTELEAKIMEVVPVKEKSKTNPEHEKV
jgi:flagellar assembly protein FliH